MLLTAWHPAIIYPRLYACMDSNWQTYLKDMRVCLCVWVYTVWSENAR